MLAKTCIIQLSSTTTITGLTTIKHSKLAPRSTINCKNVAFYFQQTFVCVWVRISDISPIHCCSTMLILLFGIPNSNRSRSVIAFNYLPYEILLKIFGHLDEESLLAIASTCQRLQEIACPAFINSNKLCLMSYTCFDPFLFDAFRNITKLMLTVCDDAVIANSLRATLPGLTILHMSFRKSPRRHQENFDKFIERHRNIVHVEIWNKSNTPFDYASLAHLNDLEELMLDELNDSLMNLTQLQTLKKLTFVDEFESVRLYEKFESQLMENRRSDVPFYSMHFINRREMLEFWMDEENISQGSLINIADNIL